MASQSGRLGEANVKAAIDKFSLRVNEIASRSKQRIHENELAESRHEPSVESENLRTSDGLAKQKKIPKGKAGRPLESKTSEIQSAWVKLGAT